MAAIWQLHESHARIAVSPVAGEVDLRYPWRGLSLAASKLPQVGILKVFTRRRDLDEPETLADGYQRGRDLVATYAQTPQRNVRSQLYWRYIAGDTGAGSGGIELILSTQTSLLDSDPRTEVESTLPAGEVHRLNDYAVLLRPRGWPLSYVEMIQPSDCTESVAVATGDSLATRWRLFPDSLEKGVIRRGRLRGIFLPRDNDLALATESYAVFVASPLVLST